jgi:hypothetical protein
MSRQRVEHLFQVVGAFLQVDGVGIDRDRARGMPRQGGDELGVGRLDGVCGRFRARACEQRANCGSNAISLGYGSLPWLGLGPLWCSST